MNPRKRKSSGKARQGASKRTKVAPDANSIPASSSSLGATTPDSNDSVKPQSATTTRVQLPMEIITQILSEFITEDALNNRNSKGKGSKVRQWRRRDICSVLLTSREFYKEASKLMQDRLALNCEIVGHPDDWTYKSRLRYLGQPGPWNQYRKIRICLPIRPERSISNLGSTELDTWKDTWKLLQQHVPTLRNMHFEKVETSIRDSDGQAIPAVFRRGLHRPES